jgi:hypothetical protein
MAITATGRATRARASGGRILVNEPLLQPRCYRKHFNVDTLRTKTSCYLFYYGSNLHGSAIKWGDGVII